MTSKAKILLFILIAFLMNLSLVLMLKSDNIFWGKGYLNKNSKATKELEDRIAENLKVKITSPLDGANISRTVKVEGIAGAEVTSVEVKLDDEDWQKAVGTAKWEITLTDVIAGTHTIYAKGSIYCLFRF